MRLALIVAIAIGSSGCITSGALICRGFVKSARMEEQVSCRERIANLADIVGTSCQNQGKGGKR